MNASVSQPIQVNAEQVLLSKGYGHGAELLGLVKDEDAWLVDSIWASRRVLKTKFSNVAIKDNLAFGLDDGILCCVDLETGDRLWKKGRYKYGQILLVDDIIVVMTEDGELVLVDANGEQHQELAKFPALAGQTWNNVAFYGEFLLVRNSEQAACYRVKLRDQGNSPMEPLQPVAPDSAVQDL